MTHPHHAGRITRRRRTAVAGCLLAAALIVAAGCSVTEDAPNGIDGPPLAGPSELGLSLAVTATPDVLSFLEANGMSKDGRSEAALAITARGPNGEVRPGVQIRLAIFHGNTNVDYGVLSTKFLETGADGTAHATYTAPPAPKLTEAADSTVDIQLMPIGDDYANMTPRRVTLRLTRAGPIVTPNPPPVASFSFSPRSPREDELVRFDGTLSTGVGLTYQWDFGDGGKSTQERPAYRFDVAGTYVVRLTVTDDQGTKSSTTQQIIVLGAIGPTAVFTISPTDPAVDVAVHFDGSPSTTAVGSGRSIVGYEWNFGDGSAIVSGSEQTVSHVYSRAGTYTVVLNVIDNMGARGTASRTVQVR